MRIAELELVCGLPSLCERFESRLTDSHLADTAGKQVNRIWLSIIELLRGKYTSPIDPARERNGCRGTVMVTDGYAAKKYQAALDRWNSKRS